MLVNLSSMSSDRRVCDSEVGLLPPIHTLSFRSTKIPCSLSGHSNPVPGPPHAATNLPFSSNSSTAGAARLRAGFGHRPWAVQDPDMVVTVHGDAGNLTEHPVVRQLRPRGVHLETGQRAGTLSACHPVAEDDDGSGHDGNERDARKRV